MRIPSNKTSDIADFIKTELFGLYEQTEINSFIFMLFENFCKISKAKLLSGSSLHVTESELLKINHAIKELKKFKPIQYIIGEAEFYGLNFFVNSSVLIPRPETEELVNWVIQENKRNAVKKILDIGTGSGCIAIAIKANIPQADVFAVDISKESIETAQQNSKINNTNVLFINADINKYKQEVVFKNLLYPTDIIISNPPYVIISEKKQMKPNVFEYEPEHALFVNNDNPFIFYSKILDFGNDFLSDNGKIYFEINEKYGNEISSLIKDKGYTRIILKKDINNKDRMICCSK